MPEAPAGHRREPCAYTLADSAMDPVASPGAGWCVSLRLSEAQNQIWCELVAPACELLAWMQMLAPNGPARRYEPKRLRLCLPAVAGRLDDAGPGPRSSCRNPDSRVVDRTRR
ncbi:hypothetical protein GCM10010517_47390 [Streptosporangium fragile]|uniref:Uncharacterized protein n=1 Tax=Streptosporangium fragile TaxID=46186 RepID=A0ABN3W149_9ACTN